MLKKQALILMFAALVLTVSTTPPHVEVRASPPEPDYWVTVTASAVQWAFNDPIWEPHYGAFFNGSNCGDQHYFGSGGDGATCAQGCISNWNWWGNYLNVLLLPKCWLYNIACIIDPIDERWRGSNYQARCWFD